MEVPVKLRSTLANIRYWLLAFTLLAVSTVLVSCGGGSTTVITVNSVADTLTIIANTNVSADEEITITAFATYNGVAVSNLTVTFLITDNQSGGSLDAGSAVTGANGRASVKYTAGIITSTTDEITVKASGLTETVDITVNPLPVGTIELSSAKPTQIANGTARVTVTALVKDTGGIPIQGVDVDFTTTAGSMCDSPACSAVANPVTATTDALGKARAILQSSTDLETATVEGETPEGYSASTTVTFIAGPAANIILQADPPIIMADAGNSKSTVTALVRDANNHIVADGVTVTFSRVAATSVGTGDFPFTPTANTVGGLAAQIFTAGATPGVVDILATALSGAVTSGSSGNALITLTPETVGSVVVTLDFDVLEADGLEFTGVYATVNNTNGFPVNNGTSVTFSTLPSGGNAGALGNLGDLPFIAPPPLVDSFSTTTTGGVATVYLQSSIVAGNYSVRAISGGKSHIVPIEFVPGLADNDYSELQVNPTSIAANGTSTAVVTLIAHDANDNPVADGTSVTFTTSSGVFMSTLTATATSTTTGGIATAVIRSSGIWTVANGVALTADTLGFTTPEPATMTFTQDSSVDPSSIQLTLSGGVDGTGTYIAVESPGGNIPATITATVRDGSNVLIPNGCSDNIQFSIITGPTGAMLDGTTTSPVIKTTLNGVASVSLSAGTASGTVRVRADVIKKRDCSTLTPPLSAITTPIVIASGPAANIFIYANPNVIDNGDSTTSQIMNAILTDTYGNPVEDRTAVIFSLDTPGLGESVCGPVYTGGIPASTCVGSTTYAKGVARTLLTWPATSIWGSFDLVADTVVGPSTILSYTYSGTYPAVAPIRINVTFNPASPVLSVYSAIEVWAHMTDGSTPFANDMEGVSLNFTSNNPAVTFPGLTSDTTGANGRATVDVNALNCSSSAAIATITASAGPFFGSAPLTVSANNQVANFTSGAGGGAGSFIVDFSSAASTPQTGGGATTYSWNFGDTTFGAGANPSHTYASAGPWSVTLTTTMATTGCSKTSATQPVTAP